MWSWTRGTKSATECKGTDVSILITKTMGNLFCVNRNKMTYPREKSDLSFVDFKKAI